MELEGCGVCGGEMLMGAGGGAVCVRRLSGVAGWFALKCGWLVIVWREDRFADVGEVGGARGGSVYRNAGCGGGRSGVWELAQGSWRGWWWELAVCWSCMGAGIARLGGVWWNGRGGVLAVEVVGEVWSGAEAWCNEGEERWVRVVGFRRGGLWGSWWRWG